MPDPNEQRQPDDAHNYERQQDTEDAENNHRFCSLYPFQENNARRCFFLRRTHRLTTHTTFSCNGRSTIFCTDGSARVFFFATLFACVAVRALPPRSPVG